jgi:hypothetical protein
VSAAQLPRKKAKTNLLVIDFVIASVICGEFFQVFFLFFRISIPRHPVQAGVTTLQLWVKSTFFWKKKGSGTILRQDEFSAVSTSMARSGLPGFGGTANNNTDATIPFPNLMWSPEMKWQIYSANPAKETCVARRLMEL